MPESDGRAQTPEVAAEGPGPRPARANRVRARLLEQAAALLRMADELYDLRHLLVRDAGTWEFAEEPPVEVVLAGALDEAMYHKLPEASGLLIQASASVPDDPLPP